MSEHIMIARNRMSIQSIHARHALTTSGWQKNVTVRIDANGIINNVSAGADTDGITVGVLLPGVANLHSHSFQRAMAGLTESRSGLGPNQAQDSFWTWRQLMYRFLERLEPEDIESVAAMVFMEMLEAGYTAVGEFHYLHHQPGGKHYCSIAETSQRIAAAARTTGIGLTLMPVLYQQSGCDGDPLTAGQQRFGNTLDSYQQILDGARTAINALGNDCRIGVAPHSLRAVPAASINAAAQLLPSGPIHIHIAEQTAEVDEVVTSLGARPVTWLLNNQDINERWCLVHATHMTPEETTALAGSGATVGLCPITEANLGDGIFDGARYLQANGVLGIGSDSNVRVSLTEELRLLEYGQRLLHQSRAVLCSAKGSNGRTLWDAACTGGAAALKRNSGAIGAGYLADLVALDDQAIPLAGLSGNQLLDSLVFAGSDALVCDVWSAGRHVVSDGQHYARDAVISRYRGALARLTADL